MAIHRSLRTNAARRNTLAACLAAALAAGAAGAVGPAVSTNAPRMLPSPDEALFGALHTIRARAAQIRTRAAGLWPALDLPAHPAASITVDSCADDNDPSTTTLRDAFAVAGDGDEIDLRALTCSTISLTSGEIVAMVPNLSVVGPGQDLLTVTANDISRVFASNYGLAITDLTIAHGGDDSGLGGCLSVNGDLTLTRSTVTDCRSGASDGSTDVSYGGGAYVAGDLIMQASTISNSSATAANWAFGGAAGVLAAVHLYDSTIDGNSATTTSSFAVGGGLLALGEVTTSGSRVINNAVSSTDAPAYAGGFFSDGNVTATLSTISGNSAHSETSRSFGGGIQSGVLGANPVTLVLNTSTVSGNTASSNCDACYTAGGGAVAFGEIFAVDSTVEDNEASSSISVAVGGGLATSYHGVYGQIVLGNSTISGNRAYGGGSGFGGGIAAISGSPFAAFNSTIAFNHATSFGGGIVGNTDGQYDPVLSSSIVARNYAGYAADLAPGYPFTGFMVMGSNNLVIASSADIAFENAPLQDDPLLQPLDDNGGPTATHALIAGSPALDQGSNAGTLAYDQRGCPFARESGGAADIGAFELQVEPADHVFGDGFDGVPVCP